MKNLLIPAFLLLAATSFALPQATTATNVGGKQTSKQGGEVRDAEALFGYEKVEDGECHTNGDGVKVCNTGTNGDDFKVNPKNGNGNSATTVDMDNDAEGTIEGLDSNDTVNVANGSSTTISGTAGATVNVPAGSNATGSVTNTGAAGSGNVNLVAGGITVGVPPGATVTFGG